MELVELGGLVVVLVVLLALDSHFFARGREATFRESVVWSLGWLALGLSVTGVVFVLNGSEDGVNYLTVYLIERSLSLDNLFVFILLFAYFGVPHAYRARLLFWGIIAALVLRGLAILGGTALIEQFHFVLYALGVLLLVLAYRIYRGVGEDVDPDKNLVVRGVRRVFPVTDGLPRGALVRARGRPAARHADLPVPRGDRRRRHRVRRRLDPGGVRDHDRPAHHLGRQRLRAARPARAVRARRGAHQALPLPRRDDRRRARPRRREDPDRAAVKIGPGASLGLVAVAFAIGIAASLIADRRDPEGAAERRKAGGRTSHAGSGLTPTRTRTSICQHVVMPRRDRHLLFGLAGLTLAVAALTLVGVHSDVLLALPVLLFALPLLAGPLRRRGAPRPARGRVRRRPPPARRRSLPTARSPLAASPCPAAAGSSPPRSPCARRRRALRLTA